MKAIRILLKSLFFSLLLGVLLLVLAMAGVYFFRDKIIQITLNEFNNHLQAKIEVDPKIEVSLLEKFPDISLRFSNIKIYETLEGSKEKLATLKRIYVTFDAFNILNEKYIINHLYIEEGFIHLKVDSSGKNNFSILKQDSTANKDGAVVFNIDKVKLSNVNVSYLDNRTNHFYDCSFHKALAKLSVVNNVYSIGLESDLLVNDIRLEDDHYFYNKQISIKSENQLDLNKDYFKILPSIINLGNAAFKIKGEIENKKATRVNLEVAESDGSIQTLLSLLPEKFTRELNFYQSEGKIFFKARVIGYISETLRPGIDVEFGFQNASIVHPVTKQRLEKANLNGFYSNGIEKSSRTSELKFSNVSGILEGKKISGNFHLMNFDDPYLNLDFRGEANALSLYKFYPIRDLKISTGLLAFDINFKGRVNDLRTLKTAQQVKASGEVVFSNFTFLVNPLEYKFQGLSGDFIFNNTDLAVTALKGSIGSSDFVIDGMFKNFINKIFFGTRNMYFDAELKSDHIDFDELMAMATTKSGKGHKSPSELEVGQNEKGLLTGINFNVLCNLKDIKYKKFKATNLKGKLEFILPHIHLEQFECNTMGGEVDVKSYVGINRNRSVETITEVSLKRINIDSVFYVFEDFDQSFITKKNIKGEYSGKIKAAISLDNNLQMIPQSIIASANGAILNGELINFGPMKKLSKFMEEEKLENIKFSELRNTIYIEDGKVSIPEMEIKSTISEIKIAGTHTFNQEMDYSLVIPLKNFKKEKRDSDEAFGAIEEVKQGEGNIFLTIKGSADNYNIAYDKRRTREKIKEDLKKEKQELQTLFKKKRKEEIESQPISSEPEFFNFD